MGKFGFAVTTREDNIITACLCIGCETGVSVVDEYWEVGLISVWYFGMVEGDLFSISPGGIVPICPRHGIEVDEKTCAGDKKSKNSNSNPAWKTRFWVNTTKYGMPLPAAVKNMQSVS